MDSGYIDSKHRDDFIRWVAEDSEEMHKINLDLYKNYDALDGDDADIYSDEDVVTWYY